MSTLFTNQIDELERQAEALADQVAALPLPDQVEALNRIRTALHRVSPFADEPIDLTLWVLVDLVDPNKYNPNFVHRPEMELLETSIIRGHLTMPVEGYWDGNRWTVVDGEHRHGLCAKHKVIRNRLHGYLPVVRSRATNENELMEATVTRNRAHGVHKLDGMTNIVLSMLANGWTDDEVAKSMGMDADEILRMRQVSGIAKAFERPAYNRAWVNDDGQETLD